jgi:hypothetical protein
MSSPILFALIFAVTVGGGLGMPLPPNGQMSMANVHSKMTSQILFAIIFAMAVCGSFGMPLPPNGQMSMANVPPKSMPKDVLQGMEIAQELMKLPRCSLKFLNIISKNLTKDCWEGRGERGDTCGLSNNTWFENDGFPSLMGENDKGIRIR